MWVVYWKATTIHCKALSQQSNIVHCQMRHKEGKDKQILIVYTMHGMPKCTCQTELASIIKLALYIVYLAANPVSQSVSRLVSHSANLKRFIATYHMWAFHNVLSAEFHKFMKIWVLTTAAISKHSTKFFNPKRKMFANTFNRTLKINCPKKYPHAVSAFWAW